MSDNWHWQFENADGTVREGGVSPSFPTQADAESWIGEEWRELLESGVEQVTLLEDERAVYGPMGLRPEA